MYISNKKWMKQIRGPVIVVIILWMLIMVGSENLIKPFMLSNNQKTNSLEEVGQIDRVLLMPNLPEPFNMRDWKQVARDYDALYFNLSQTGTYLPLISLDTNLWGTTTRDVFKSPSYVGLSMADEAINTMAAVLSATLVGIDKSNQDGYNWVEMCENWYNIGNGQDIYLNNLHAGSKTSFWYVLFPNLIFYQLAYYYPETGDFQNQIRGVADKWYNACESMGGIVDPWTLPNFEYTAFDFSTMLPYYNGMWKEPDAAAAIAWLEYIAYMKYGDPKYLVAAEWCIQYLTQLTYNPLYEILLPYGAYITARMNAELGKDYDINKIINWCFGPADSRSGWGVIAQNWSGYDVHGLHGSITDGGGYAFSMGTFENIGCLVPVVRYDDRYAQAIGKYVLNGANAARLFYGNGLDASHQDSEDWIEIYDPNNCVGYESLRKTWDGLSPHATGDVNRDRYKDQNGPTNLGLYGSSHVGIFGGIIGSTNDEKILQLDCLTTDYFHDEAYPTYLYYNPYDINKTVEIDLGPTASNLYDTITDNFLATHVSGITSFQLPADTAAVVVVVPADGVITYDGKIAFINNIIVDYNSDTAITTPTSTTTAITVTTNTSSTTSESGTPSHEFTGPTSGQLMTITVFLGFSLITITSIVVYALINKKKV